VDGNKGVDGYAGKQKIEPKADGNYWVVAAASILAKIIRDDLMIALGEQFPKYGWGKNKGYPTPDHKEALVELGLSTYHRQKASTTFLKKVKK
jgi:ribonuclease HII